MVSVSSKPRSPVSGALEKSFLLGAVALLLLGWAAQVWFITEMTELTLPYDTSWYDYWGWPEGSPPPGSWQRVLNYFLESLPGRFLPAALIVGAEILFLGMLLLRVPQLWTRATHLFLSFALLDLVSIPVMFLGAYECGNLLADRFQGWARTFIFWFPIIFLLILRFILQVRIIPGRLFHRSR